MRLIRSLIQSRPHGSASVLSRDRLLFFRQLFLVFALFTLGGIAVTLRAANESPSGRLTAIVCAVALGAWWVYGYRQRRFSTFLILAEAVLLIGFTASARDPVMTLPAYFIGSQYRALFGSRRATWLLTFAYGFAFVIGIALSSVGLAVITPVVHVEALALGFCTYVLHSLKEVLERDQERERALRESEQRFRSVAENLREALLIADVGDKIIFANSRVRDVLGYEPDEVLGKSATELLLPASQRNVFRDRLHLRLSGDSELYEAELLRKDGKHIHTEVSASPYRDASGTIIGTLGAISDISDRKRLEDRLRQGMRMEAVGQLAGGVAHDFNNLLTVIKCHTELLLDDIGTDHSAREDIGEITKAANRGAALTHQLLAFSRKQMLQPKRVVLAEVVADCVPRLRQLVRNNVLLLTLNDESTAQVFADKLQLEHALAILVQNSSEAMPKGGKITIETRSMDITDERPSVATQEMPTGRYATLIVSDTGVGMEPDVLARLFEPFFTTKGPGEGSGLGLASMYGIVRQSGGFVDVESAPNVGTMFRIYLPFARDAARVSPAAAELMPV